MEIFQVEISSCGGRDPMNLSLSGDDRILKANERANFKAGKGNDARSALHHNQRERPVIFAWFQAEQASLV